jgi:hypothetical protein
MGPLQTTIAVFGLIALSVLMAGLVVRHRYGVAYTFTLYLIVVFVTEVVTLAWPDTFYRRSFYLQKENVINALRFAIALELMYRTFSAFPSAHRTARTLFLTLLTATLVVVVASSGEQPDAFTLLNKVQPRVISATVWLFTALAALILWYRLPVESFHKAILLGWVPFLLIFSAALNYVGEYGLQVREISNYIHTLAYLGLLGYWARAAWAPASEPVSPAARPAVALQNSAS